MTHPTVLLSIVIVSWNVADLLAACLTSLIPVIARDDTEVIVIDSASTDDTVARVQARFPRVIVLPQSENIGFTQGNNLGFAAARGRYLLMLNPDTEVIGDAVERMAAYLETHPGIAIVGAHTLNSDGSHQSTRRRFPTIATALFESTWLQPIAPHVILDRYFVRDAADDAIVAVDWVQGSALMARRSVYEQLGGLDTGYVMYSEEMDWCRRAKDAGWGVVYLGDARIVHHGGKSTDQIAARRHIHFQESKLRYFRKYHGRLVAHGLRWFLLAMYATQLLVEAAKGALGHKRALRRERVRQYWQVLHSGLRVS
ncbi:MAG: glycosyltransferase family 2 protein [Chloroflexota bacterium]|nr:glycosyltransferase family 2 protein [Chloroflexota bacterium]